MILVLSLTLLFPSSAVRWGFDGHRLLCATAWTIMTPEARRMVDGLIGEDADTDFAEACVWADRARSTTHPDTGPHHYVNLPPRASGYDERRDCGAPAPSCITWAIDHHARILSDRSQPRPNRAESLRFLAHFVGDVHQPLHAGYAHDRGGNTTEVVFLGDSLNGSRPWNLHSVWDWAALSEAGFDWPADSARAIEELRSAIEDVDTAYDPVRWTEESFQLTETVVYDLARQTSADRAYLDRAMPVIQARLRQAAARLAALLNAIASDRFGE